MRNFYSQPRQPRQYRQSNIVKEFACESLPVKVKASVTKMEFVFDRDGDRFQICSLGAAPKQDVVNMSDTSEGQMSVILNDEIVGYIDVRRGNNKIYGIGVFVEDNFPRAIMVFFDQTERIDHMVARMYFVPQYDRKYSHLVNKAK